MLSIDIANLFIVRHGKDLRPTNLSLNKLFTSRKRSPCGREPAPSSPITSKLGTTAPSSRQFTARSRAGGAQ